MVGAMMPGLVACAADESAEANGIEDKSAVVAFIAGSEATTSRADIVYEGTVAVDGEKADIDAKIGGPRGQAAVVADDYRFEVITGGGQIFVRGDAAFWEKEVGKASAKKINDRWARSLQGGELQPFAQFTDIDTYLRASGRIKKGDVVDVGGEPALTISDPTTNTASTWWFATTGDPLMLKYTSGKETALVFNYDDAVFIDLPEPGDVVDISGIKFSTPRPTPTPTKK
jgi:hypothetical protein